jgi:hypothetical protein
VAGREPTAGMEDLNVPAQVYVAYAFFTWTVFGFFGELAIMVWVNEYIQDQYSMFGTLSLETIFGFLGKQIII